MTRQVTAGSPITIVARSQVGGFIPDAPLSIDGDVYRDADCTVTFDELRCNGAGEFVCYAPPGSVITVLVGDPIATDLEPIQVVGVGVRPGGLTAEHPGETPAVHEQSPVSEQVSDASLVGAVHPDAALSEDEGGALAMVGVDRAQNQPPAEPEPVPESALAEEVAVETPTEAAALGE